jgi:uncharacterized protein
MTALIGPPSTVTWRRCRRCSPTGPMLTPRWKDGFAALMLATQKGHAYVRALLELAAEAEANRPAEDLFNAVENGDATAVQALLANGADVNAKLRNGRTVLMAASYCGYREVLHVLLANGANVNAKDADGGTALMAACQKGHREVVQALFAHGATQVNAKTKYSGVSALMEASENGHLDVVQALLEKGADVNTKSDDGRIALTLATQKGHADVGALLVQAGAKPLVTSGSRP